MGHCDCKSHCGKRANTLVTSKYYCIFFSVQLESKHLLSSQLVSLLTSFIEKTWCEKVTQDDHILPFILEWKPMINYLQRFGNIYILYSRMVKSKKKELKKIFLGLQK